MFVGGEQIGLESQLVKIFEGKLRKASLTMVVVLDRMHLKGSTATNLHNPRTNVRAA